MTNPTAFISYAREDQFAASEIAELLTNNGIDVRWDKDLIAGENYAHRLADTLDSVDVVIVLWSPAAVKSTWVISEAKTGLERKVLIPVMIKKTRIINPYNALHTIEMPVSSDFPSREGSRTLLQAVKERLATTDAVHLASKIPIEISEIRLTKARSRLMRMASKNAQRFVYAVKTRFLKRKKNLTVDQHKRAYSAKRAKHEARHSPDNFDALVDSAKKPFSPRTMLLLVLAAFIVLGFGTYSLLYGIDYMEQQSEIRNATISAQDNKGLGRSVAITDKRDSVGGIEQAVQKTEILSPLDATVAAQIPTAIEQAPVAEQYESYQEINPDENFADECSVTNPPVLCLFGDTY